MRSEDFIYKKDFTINPKDSDFKSEMRPGALVGYFIQAAWRHAEELGFGYSQLIESGVGWILSRFTFQIHKMPVWPGEFRLETWPKGRDRILYIRDAELYDPDKSKLVSITSAWLVIDMETKRLKRSLPETDYFSELEKKNAIKENIPSLCPIQGPVHLTPFEVRYNDIDINMHLTTVRYVDFMFDTYDIDFLNKNTPAEITVNFIKEVPFGTCLMMKRIEKDGVHHFELVNEDKDTVCFRGIVKYLS